MSEQDLRLQYAQEDAINLATGILPLHEVSRSAFIMMGLDLEEQQ